MIGTEDYPHFRKYSKTVYYDQATQTYPNNKAASITSATVTDIKTISETTATATLKATGTPGAEIKFFLTPDEDEQTGTLNDMFSNGMPLRESSSGNYEYTIQNLAPDTEYHVRMMIKKDGKLSLDVTYVNFQTEKVRQEAPTAADVSINYEQETLENKASCDLEYAASNDAQSWTTIRQGGMVRLTGLLDNIRENGGSVPFYIRKKASSSMSASEAVFVANLQTQAIPEESNKPNIDYRKEEITISSSLQYVIVNGTNTSPNWTSAKMGSGSGISITDIISSDHESTVYYRYATSNTDEKFAGKPERITILKRTAAPAAITEGEVDITGTTITINRTNPENDIEYGYRDVDSDGAFTWIDGTKIQGLYPAHGYQVTSRIKAKENAFASERTEPLNVSTKDTLRIVGNGTPKWDAKGTYGVSLAQIPVSLASGYGVYNGANQLVAGTWSWEPENSSSASGIYPNVKDNKAYTVKFTPTDSSASYDRTLTDSVVPEISKYPLNFSVAVEDKTYDGTTNADISSVTFEGSVTLQKDKDYTVTASFDDADVGSGKNVTATVTLTGQAAKNYALEQSSFPTTGSIIKAAAPDFTKETALTIVNGHEKTYTVTLPALPTLETPKEYGALTYEIGEIKLNDGYYTSGAKVENGKLILPIQAVETKETGSIGSVKVNVSTTNYHDFTLTINVIAKNRITPTGTPTLSKNAITYGDALNTIALSGKLYDNVNNVDVDGTFEWVDGTHIPVVGNGTYAAEWIFEPTDTEKYLTVSGRSNITVEKVQQYGKVSMDDYVYGETPSTPSLTDRTGDGSVTYYYSTTNSNSGGTKWENIQADTLNAGTYYMYAELGETENYDSFTTACEKFRVLRAMPTCTKPTGLTAIYGQTLADVKLPDGWSWMNSSESVGDASTVTKTFQAKFTPTDTDNYNMVENIELEVMVNKADGGNLKTVELEQKYTDASEHTYTPDWARLPAGQDWTFSSEASIVLPKQDFAADGNLLTYAISGGKAGDKITITLKASCDNYEDFTIALTITLTEKDNQQALRITGGITVVYGQTLQLGTSGGSGSGAVTYTVTNGTGEATIDSNSVLTPVRIGSVTVTATKAGDSEYNAVTSSPVEITITRAVPTGEPAYTKITASGKTLADAALGIGAITPAGGTIAWDDPTTTEVVANKSYGWTYTPTDTNYTTLTGSIQLWHKSASSGGGSYYAPTVPDMPMLYRGCTGDAVKTLQDKLNTLGYNSGNVDGIFGAKTYAAVTAFQKANNLGVDGIVGKLTWAKLYDATPVNVTPVTTQPMLRTGSRGDAVRKLQEMLNAKGYTCGSVDGIFGSKTKAAVLAFQKANGLGADGIVGPLTWGKLV